jgi:hypothetical protein
MSDDEIIYSLFGFSSVHRKRINRIERLATEVGASVYYPLNEVARISVTLSEGGFECRSLRDAERLLRTIKRRPQWLAAASESAKR